MKTRRLYWIAILSLAVLPGLASAEKLDWARLDPALAGAAFVGDDKVCAECHDDYLAAYGKTRHARAGTCQRF